MGTRSTSTSTARTSSSRLSSPTTVPSSSLTTAVWSPRSSVVLVPVPGTRSPTDRWDLVVLVEKGAVEDLWRSKSAVAAGEYGNACMALLAHGGEVMLYAFTCAAF